MADVVTTMNLAGIQRSLEGKFQLLEKEVEKTQRIVEKLCQERELGKAGHRTTCMMCLNHGWHFGEEEEISRLTLVACEACERGVDFSAKGLRILIANLFRHKSGGQQAR